MATSTNQQNFSYIKQQLGAVLGNSSVVVKFICLTIVVGYFLSFSDTTLSLLTVTPGYVSPPNFWIWTYFTHSFIESHVWNLLVDICVIILYGKLLEPLWGALEMLLFYIVVNVSVAVLTGFTYVLIYLVTRNEEYLFDIHIHGLAGYIAGFSVAVKQVMPDHILVNSPFGKVRNKHVPFTLLYLAIIVRILGLVDGPYPIMFGMGILVSWTYLRFYQKHSSGNRGDMADSFMFASFFPLTTQPLIAAISNSVFGILVKLRICRKPQRKYDVSAPTTITVSLPGTDPQDAERRRQLALKALNERLSKVDQPLNWPSMDEGTEGATPPPKSHGESSISNADSTTIAVPDFKENATENV